MTKLHLHLLSDATGETLESIAKASIAQFEDVQAIRHFWPMVRSEDHLERILREISANPGLVLFTLFNPVLRRKLEHQCRAMGLPYVGPLDSVTDAMSNILGQEARNRPGRKHILDEAYFARIEAIQYTIAHDDGVGEENWDEA
ncbi:MAG: kinase/pyrophosphorylase, partial [Rhodospirillaceae bacterium]|nr:kinase/pyrophosphorylase [Rhodospirillaceae bacterium]